MEEKSKFIVFLSQFDIINSKYDKILEYLDETNLFESFKKCSKLVEDKVLSPDGYKKMKSYASEEEVDKFLSSINEREIKVVTKYDNDYPSKLVNLPDAPNILYCKGNYSLVGMPSLGVVGTRKPSRYGIITTEKLVKDIASCGIVIISGLAYGVDSIAHRKCLDVNGQTIAVLACGFDNIFPAQHIGLANEIVEKGGLLLSEYRPKAIAYKYTFPIRNRIIAALSEGILISEAGIKSGTSYTKDYALDYGKNIYAVPGQINCETSYLPNKLIKDGEANLVMTSEDILLDYDLATMLKENIKDKKVCQLSIEEELICKNLENGMKSIDELSALTNLNINILNTCLTTLEINEIIKRLPGGVFALA